MLKKFKNIIRPESFSVATVLSTSFNVVSKGLAFLVNIVIASSFGANEQTDLYFFLFSLTILLTIFITSMDSSVIIPEFMRREIQSDKESAFLFISFFFLIYICVGISISLLIFFFPIEIFSHISKFSFFFLQSKRTMLLLFAPLVPLTVLTSFLLDYLTSRKMFTMSVLCGILNSLVVIVTVFFLRSSYGVESVLVGQIVGYTIQLMLLIAIGKSRFNFNLGKYKNIVGRSVLKNIGFAQLGNVSTFISSFLPYYLFSGIEKGTITALNLGQKAADIPTQIITVQFSNVLGIKLNELYSQKQYAEFGNIFAITLKALLTILSMFMFLLVFNSNFIVTILYKRGMFDQEAINRTSWFLKYLCFLIPLNAISASVARVFMATQRIKESFWYQLSLSVFSVILMLILVPYYGVPGYIFTILFTFSLNAIFVYFLMKKYFPFVDYGGVVLFFLKLFFISGICIFIAHYAIGKLMAVNSGLFFLCSISIIAATYFLFVFLVAIDNGLRQFLNSFIARLRA